jgi:hypothetical protein
MVRSSLAAAIQFPQRTSVHLSIWTRPYEIVDALSLLCLNIADECISCAQGLHAYDRSVEQRDIVDAKFDRDSAGEGRLAGMTSETEPGQIGHRVYLQTGLSDSGAGVGDCELIVESAAGWQTGALD